jgi:hypothetical protein
MFPFRYSPTDVLLEDEIVLQPIAVRSSSSLDRSVRSPSHATLRTTFLRKQQFDSCRLQPVQDSRIAATVAPLAPRGSDDAVSVQRGPC